MNAIQTASAIAAVNALDLAPIKTKLMHQASGEGWSATHANAVEIEYRRFLTLMKLYPNDSTAPLVDVDTFWHYHILDTAKYAADCAKAFGYFLHHYPYLGLNGEEDETARDLAGARMHALYAATFGADMAAAPAAWCGMATTGPAQQATAWCGMATTAPAQQATAWCGMATTAPAQQATAWCGMATTAPAQQATAWCGMATSQQARPALAWCGATSSAPVKPSLAWCGAAAPAASRLAWCGMATATPVKSALAWCGAAQPTRLQVSDDITLTALQAA